MEAGAESSGRLAIVTGAARGIGYGIAERLAQSGIHVVLIDVLPEVWESAARLRAENFSAEALMGDISDESFVVGAIRDIRDRHGHIDILVNNAGISPKKDGRKILVKDTDLAQWNQVLAINMTGAFLFCREVAPLMTRQHWGRIINISSQAARTKSEIAGAAYVASKAGLIGFSRVLAAELAGDGITVNSVAPGRIESPMVAVAGDDVNNAYVAKIPVGRIGKANDVAAAVAFLASDEASFITGAIIDVNGGVFMG